MQEGPPFHSFIYLICNLWKSNISRHNKNPCFLKARVLVNIFLYLTPYSNFSMIYPKLRTDVSPVILWKVRKSYRIIELVKPLPEFIRNSCFPEEIFFLSILLFQINSCPYYLSLLFVPIIYYYLLLFKNKKI